MMNAPDALRHRCGSIADRRASDTLPGMWSDRPEQLKAHWTGRPVAVRPDAAVGSLARFAGLTGRVRTVNMNGRALVQFDGRDETWFDLDPAALEEVPEAAPPDAPPVEPAVGKEPKTAPPAERPAAGDPPPKPGRILSVLELARRQGAAKS